MTPRASIRVGRGGYSGLLLAGALSVAVGCGPDAGIESGDRRPAGEVAGSETPRVENRGAQVRFAEGRVSVHSNAALRLSILEQLAEQAGFELVVGDVEARPMTLRIDDAPLSDALPVLLEGVSYGVHYTSSEEGHRLARLRVGESVEVTAMRRAIADAAAARRRDDARAARWEGREERREQLEQVFDRMDDLTRRAPPADDRDIAEMNEQIVGQLESPDAEERARALSLLPEKDAHRPQVISLLESDPDPSVRAAAAKWMGAVGSHAGVSALVGALGDPAPDVTLAAIEALEYTGDESLIVHLEPLLQSPDPRVREAATQAIAFLE